MSLWRLAWGYAWSRGLVTLLTILSVALGVALIAAVLTLRRESQRAFLEEGVLFDMVVGAKGSPLQLVLSTVYHLDVPPGNIPWTRYEALAADPRVARAIPIGLGDNFRGYRIVGTNEDFFAIERRNPDTGERHRVLSIAEGRTFQQPFEAVLGAQVARLEGLAPGATFAGTHGLMALAGSEEHADFPYAVVGVLAPTGSAMDRAVYTPIDSVWQVHEAEKELHNAMFAADDDEEDAEAGEDDGHFLMGYGTQRREIQEATAVLLQLKTPGMRLWMADEVRRETESMAAIPINEMLRLYQRVLAPMQSALLAVAWLVVVVSALTILTTLYQAAERRRRDLAVMRALGAHPSEVFAIVLLEALLLTLAGMALGWLMGHGGVALASGLLRERLGLGIGPMDAFSTGVEEARALAAVALSGLLAGLVPAILAYRRSPHSDLAAN